MSFEVTENILSDSSDDELPSFFDLEVRSHRSEVIPKKSIEELLEQNQALKNAIAVQVNEAKIESELEGLQYQSDIPYDEQSVSPPPAVEEEEEGLGCIFGQLNWLQYFSAEDVTFVECDYVCETETVPEEDFLLSLKQEKILQLVFQSGLANISFERIKNLKMFTHYVLRKMSVNYDEAYINNCSKVIKKIITKQNAISVSFTDSDIFKILFNYGVDVPTVKYFEMVPHVKKLKTKPCSLEYLIPDNWLFNLKAVLSSIKLLILNCGFKADDLFNVILYLIIMSTDTKLMHCEIFIELQNCLAATLSKFPESSWHVYRSRVTLSVISLAKSLPSKSSWTYILRMVESLPVFSHRGSELQKFTSFAALKTIVDPDSSESFEDFLNVPNFLSIVESIRCLDTFTQSLSTKFIDMFVSHLEFASLGEYHEVYESLKKWETGINTNWKEQNDTTSWKVKTYLLDLHSRLSLLMPVGSQKMVNDVTEIENGTGNNSLKSSFSNEVTQENSPLSNNSEISAEVDTLMELGNIQPQEETLSNSEVSNSEISEGLNAIRIQNSAELQVTEKNSVLSPSSSESSIVIDLPSEEIRQNNSLSGSSSEASFTIDLPVGDGEPCDAQSESQFEKKMPCDEWNTSQSISLIPKNKKNIFPESVRHQRTKKHSISTEISKSSTDIVNEQSQSKEAEFTIPSKDTKKEPSLPIIPVINIKKENVDFSLAEENKISDPVLPNLYFEKISDNLYNSLENIVFKTEPVTQGKDECSHSTFQQIRKEFPEPSAHDKLINSSDACSVDKNSVLHVEMTFEEDVLTPPEIDSFKSFAENSIQDPLQFPDSSEKLKSSQKSPQIALNVSTNPTITHERENTTSEPLLSDCKEDDISVKTQISTEDAFLEKTQDINQTQFVELSGQHYCVDKNAPNSPNDSWKARDRLNESVIKTGEISQVSTVQHAVSVAESPIKILPEKSVQNRESIPFEPLKEKQNCIKSAENIISNVLNASPNKSTVQKKTFNSEFQHFQITPPSVTVTTPTKESVFLSKDCKYTIVDENDFNENHVVEKESLQISVQNTSDKKSEYADLYQFLENLDKDFQAKQQADKQRLVISSELNTSQVKNMSLKVQDISPHNMNNILDKPPEQCNLNSVPSTSFKHFLLPAANPNKENDSDLSRGVGNVLARPAEQICHKKDDAHNRSSSVPVGVEKNSFKIISSTNESFGSNSKSKPHIIRLDTGMNLNSDERSSLHKSPKYAETNRNCGALIPEQEHKNSEFNTLQSKNHVLQEINLYFKSLKTLSPVLLDQTNANSNIASPEIHSLGQAMQKNTSAQKRASTEPQKKALKRTKTAEVNRSKSRTTPATFPVLTRNKGLPDGFRANVSSHTSNEVDLGLTCTMSQSSVGTGSSQSLPAPSNTTMGQVRPNTRSFSLLKHTMAESQNSVSKKVNGSKLNWQRSTTSEVSSLHNKRNTKMADNALAINSSHITSNKIVDCESQSDFTSDSSVSLPSTNDNCTETPKMLSLDQDRAKTGPFLQPKRVIVIPQRSVLKKRKATDANQQQSTAVPVSVEVIHNKTIENIPVDSTGIVSTSNPNTRKDVTISLSDSDDEIQVIHQVCIPSQRIPESSVPSKEMSSNVINGTCSDNAGASAKQIKTKTLSEQGSSSKDPQILKKKLIPQTELKKGIGTLPNTSTPISLFNLFGTSPSPTPKKHKRHFHASSSRKSLSAPVRRKKISESTRPQQITQERRLSGDSIISMEDDIECIYSNVGNECNIVNTKNVPEIINLD